MTPKEKAFDDIRDYIKKNDDLKKQEWNGFGWDIWTVGPRQLEEANKHHHAVELGLYSINRKK